MPERRPDNWTEQRGFAVSSDVADRRGEAILPPALRGTAVPFPKFHAGDRSTASSG